MKSAYNWIVFVSPSGIEWEFMFSHGKEYQEHVLKLASALHSLGEDVFGEGLGLLRVVPHQYAIQDESFTLMFVRLSSELYMIISEPETTAKLLHLQEAHQLPEVLRDQARSVLIGSLIMMYSQFWGSDLHAGLQGEIDSIFQLNMKRVGVEDKASVSNGACSFSQLSLSELILLHYYMQRSFEDNKKFHGTTSWAVIAGKDGVPLYRYWNLEYGAACSLAAMMSAIYWFTKQMFNFRPKEMTFGITNFTKMTLFFGDSVFMAAANAAYLLFQDLGFQQLLFKTKDEILRDIEEELRKFMIHVVVTEHANLLADQTLERIIEHYRTLTAGQGLFVEEMDVDLRKPLKESISLIRSITDPNLIDPQKILEILPHAFKILVTNTSIHIKRVFLESIPSAELRVIEVEGYPVEILRTTYQFMDKTLKLEFWFIDQKVISASQMAILSSKVALNTDHIVIAHSFKDSRVFPPITKHVSLVAQNTGKSYINTTVLLLDYVEDSEVLRQALNMFYRVKDKIRKRHSLLCLPLRRVTPESFKLFLDTIVAQHAFDLYWYS